MGDFALWRHPRLLPTGGYPKALTGFFLTPQTVQMNTRSIIVTHTLPDENPTDNPEATRIVTRGMMRNRAVELAVMNGRLPHEASKGDWEDAKRELVASPEPVSPQHAGA